MKKILSLVLCLAMVLSIGAIAHAEPIQINYWPVFTGADGATMQGMVDAFNASQDEVFVNHTPMTADDLYQKIPLTVQTGTDIPQVCTPAPPTSPRTPSSTSGCATTSPPDGRWPPSAPHPWYPGASDCSTDTEPPATPDSKLS